MNFFLAVFIFAANMDGVDGVSPGVELGAYHQITPRLEGLYEARIRDSNKIETEDGYAYGLSGELTYWGSSVGISGGLNTSRQVTSRWEKSQVRASVGLHFDLSGSRISLRHHEPVSGETPSTATSLEGIWRLGDWSVGGEVGVFSFDQGGHQEGTLAEVFVRYSW